MEQYLALSKWSLSGAISGLKISCSCSNVFLLMLPAFCISHTNCFSFSLPFERICIALVEVGRGGVGWMFRVFFQDLLLAPMLCLLSKFLQREENVKEVSELSPYSFLVRLVVLPLIAVHVPRSILGSLS